MYQHVENLIPQIFSNYKAVKLLNLSDLDNEMQLPFNSVETSAMNGYEMLLTSIVSKHLRLYLKVLINLVISILIII